MNEFQIQYPVKLEYKKHKATGKGCCSYPTFNAKGERKRKFEYFPGKYKSKESKTAFDTFCRVIMQGQPQLTNGNYHYTLGEVLRDWIKEIDDSNVMCIAVAQMLTRFKKIPANDFSTKHFKQVVKHICQVAVDTQAWNITSVRKVIKLVKDVFRFGSEEAMCDESVLAALKTVRTNSIVKKFQSKIRKKRQARVPSKDEIAAVLAVASPTMRAMIIIACETGMRPSELANLNKDEIDAQWRYIPEEHKNAFRGHERAPIYLNEVCQKALNDLSLIRPDKLNPHYFTIKEHIAFKQQQRRKDVFTAKRVMLLRSPVTHDEAAVRLGVSNTCVRRWRDELKTNDFSVTKFYNRTVVEGSELFDKDKFYKHLQKACDKAGVERFYPYSFRHHVAQDVRDTHGLEAASALLGHKNLNTTELYAQKSEELAKQIAELRALSAAGEEE